MNENAPEQPPRQKRIKTPMTPDDIGRKERLAARMKALGMSDEEMAKLAGVSEYTVRSHRLFSDSGRRNISEAQAKDYAPILKVSFDWLWSGDDNPSANVGAYPLCGLIGNGGYITNVIGAKRVKWHREIVVKLYGDTAVLAFLIEGPARFTHYRPETVLLCDAHTKDVASLIGEDAVCCCGDGVMRFGELEAGDTTGRFNLSVPHHYEYKDLEIQWAARVSFTARAGKYEVRTVKQRYDGILYPPCSPAPLDQSISAPKGGGAKASPARRRGRGAAA